MGSVKKNFLYNGFLTTANYIFPLVVYPYVARVIGVANMGAVNFVDSIINYFILFSAMGINVLGIRAVASCQGNKKKLSECFSTLFTLTLTLTIVAMGVLGVLTVVVDKFRENWEMMMFGGFKVLFNCIMIQWFFQGLEQFRYITLRTLAVKLLYAASIFIFIREASDYPLFYLLSVLSIGLNAIINYVYSHRFVRFSFHGINFRDYLKPFFTLGAYVLLTSMYGTLNVAILGFVSNDTEVGYYTTAIKIYTIILGLFSAFTAVMLPRMSALISEGEKEKFVEMLRKSQEVLLAFSFPMIAFFIWFASPVILLFAGPQYEGAVVPMQMVMSLLYIVGYAQILVVQTLMPCQQDRVVFRNAMIGAALGLILNFTLVPHLAAIGSALVLVICEIVVTTLSQIAVGRVMNLNFEWKYLLRYIVCYLPLCAIFFIMLKWGGNSIGIMLAGMGVTVVYSLVLQLVVLRSGYVSMTLWKMAGRLRGKK